MDAKSFGQLIRRKRLAKGWSIARLAEKADIGDDHLGKVERGTSTLSVQSLINIANALECGLDELLGRELVAVSAETYLGQDVNELLKNMNEEQRKLFLEFLRLNSSFFATLK